VNIVRAFSAAVVGLGQIGQGYDYDVQDGSRILTHAAAFAQHPGFVLLGGVDKDPEQRRRFVEKYHLPAYPDLASLWSEAEPEVYALAVPMAQHFQLAQALIGKRPLSVLCEKPMTDSLVAGYEMVSDAEAHGCALAVNYIRRCEPGVKTLRAEIQTGKFGEIFKGKIWYGRGLHNSASHFIDLLRFLLGEVAEVQVMKTGRLWAGSDPEPDVCLYFGETPVYLLAGQAEHYSLAEMELLGTKGTIVYREGGRFIGVRRTISDPDFPRYTILNRNEIVVPNELCRYQWFVQDHLYRHLDAGEPLCINGQNALRTLEVIERIISSLRKE
jgi:predicted dehydrogenase